MEQHLVKYEQRIGWLENEAFIRDLVGNLSGVGVTRKTKYGPLKAIRI